MDGPVAIPITQGDLDSTASPDQRDSLASCNNSQAFWPDDSISSDIAGIQQISNDVARCTGVWVCDRQNQPRLDFEQGQTARFYSEYEVIEDIEVPIGGVLLRNGQNVVVHGKTSLQHDTPVPRSVKAGSRLRFCQEIVLDVATGEYSFDVGLATIGAQDFDSRGVRTNLELHQTTANLCLLLNVGRVMVTDRTERSPVQLLHHGLANLPGGCTLAVVAPAAAEVRVRQPEPKEESDLPAIFHVTHWKAGSQWIYRILAACEPDRIVAPKLADGHVRLGARAGKIYPAVYFTQQQFAQVRRPENSRHFVVIRDLRDTLVSAYFSMKLSHRVVTQDLIPLRHALNSASGDEEGLLYMMDHWLAGAALIQQSWLETGQPVIRYEDLLEHDSEILEPVLIDECGFSTPRGVCGRSWPKTDLNG